MPATVDDVAQLAMALPDVTEGLSWGRRTWSVGGKGFVWVRPFSKADLKRFGDETPPDGEIVGVRVEDLAEKEAVLQSAPRGFFTISHFDGYPAVLIQLKVVGKRALATAIEDAWLACAKPAVAEQYLTGKRRPR